MLKYFFKKPVTISMLAVLLVLVGLISAYNIPLKMFGEGFEFKFLNVSIDGYQLSPREADFKIGKPVSELIKTISGIKSVSSYSGSRNTSFSINLNRDTDQKAIYLALENVLEKAGAFLPKNTKYRIHTFDFESNSAALSMMVKKSADASAKEVNKILFEKLEPSLERIEGVANVEIKGIGKDQIIIRLRDSKIKTLNLFPEDIIQTIRSFSEDISVGNISDRDLVISGTISSLEDIKNLAITFNVALKDIADIYSDKKMPRSRYSFDGEMGAGFIQVFKKGDANLVAVCDKVASRIAEFNKKYKDKVEILTYDNQGEAVRDSINILVKSGVIAGIIAFFIVLFFLRDLVITTVVSLSIPLSILGTILWLYFSEQSINLFSMIGLMICIGLVVDNAIVIVESIYSQYIALENSSKAVYYGVKKVVLPIVMGTLTTIGVFLPVMVMSSNEISFFMQKIGFPVCVALLWSLFISVLIVPVFTKILLDIKHSSRKGTKPKPYYQFTSIYRKFLGICLNRKFESILILFLFAGITIVTDSSRVEEKQESTSMWVSLDFEFEKSLSDIQKKDYFDQVENITIKYKKKFDIEQVISSYSSDRFWLGLIRDTTSDISDAAVKNFYKSKFPIIPGIKLDFDMDSDPSSYSKYQESISFFGEKAGTLDKLAKQIMDKYKPLKGVKEVSIKTREKTDQTLQIIPDRLRSNTDTIYNNLAYYLNERHVFTMDDQTEVLVISDKPVDTLFGLRNFPIGPEPKQPLNTLSEFSFTTENENFWRKDGNLNKEITIEFDSSLSDEELAKAKLQVKSISETIVLPTGYNFSKDLFLTKSENILADSILGGVLSLALVFIIMSVMFESIFFPFIILLSVGFAYLGTIWVSFLGNVGESAIAHIGLIVLVGVVVNSGIVLVSLINDYVKDFSLDEAIMKASAERIRPILMTSATTIFGLLPMALGKSNMFGISFGGMGQTIVGGMISSTILTLIFIPIFYKMFFQARIFMTSLISTKLLKS